MIDQLISFETAKLAKEKGFNEKVRFIWFDNKEKPFIIDNLESDTFMRGHITGEWNGNMHYKKDKNETYTSAPTQSLLQKWLREIHKTDIIISIFLDMYIVSIYRYNKVLSIYEDGSMKKFTKYEDALEAGLQQGLKLIK